MALWELMQMEYELHKIDDAVMTIAQYNCQDNQIGEYTGTFQEVFDNIFRFDQYYYRVAALGKHESSKRISSNHFGVNTSSIGSLTLSEEGFLNAYLNKLVKEYGKARHAEDYMADLYNFAFIIIHDFWFVDKMQDLKQNTAEEFNDVIDRILRKYRALQKIEDINILKEQPGIYLLVLDKYNSCYLGQSNDIRKRIMRHWSRNDYFTGTGIDMFKAYDTTRIYAATTKDRHRINTLEYNIVNDIPPKYTLNCMAGGDIDYLLEEGKSILKAPNKENDFTNYTDYFYNISQRIKDTQARFIVRNR